MPPVRTILVHLNDPRRVQSLLAAALGLAGRHAARLFALHVSPIGAKPPGHLFSLSAATGRAALAAGNEAAEAISRAFEACVAARRNEGYAQDATLIRLQAPHMDLAALVMAYGRTADLIVASQADPEWELAPVLDFPERLAVESGRPVLIVPGGGRFDAIGRRVVIAWNGSREASRAAFDALPLLAGADTVSVLAIGHDRQPNEQPQEAHTAQGSHVAAPEALIASLGRHGVAADLDTPQPTSREPGRQILDHAAATHSDLLVMGAYGHSRLRELVFGGTTRFVARHAPVPVLFSH